MSNRSFWIAAVLLLATSVAAQDDDDEQPPGLLARYEVDQAIVERVDPDIAFRWGKASPDPRLPAGPFRATWSGTLLLRSADKYHFHAYLQGQVALKVNGEVVLEGHVDKPQWISGPEVALTFGDQPFEVSFAKTAGEAQLKLYWSSTDFPLEPVPYHVLFQTKPSPELTLIDRGRVQFEAFRCGNCHQTPKVTERLEAPSLKQAGVGTRRDWLVEKLMRGTADTPQGETAKMPHFGFGRDDAEAIVTALLSKAVPVELAAGTKLKETERAKDLQAGTTLVRSVGCLACHTWSSLGEATPFGGGSLDALASKRTPDWLTTWLTVPARLNPRHRMPVFTLTDKERALIVLALSTPSEPVVGQESSKVANEAMLARGAKLIEVSGCASCHELPGSKDPQTAVALADARVNWDRSCARASTDPTRHQPAFPTADAKAIQAYVASWRSGALASPAEATVSGWLLERKNCTGCHDRDGSRGISKHAAAIAKGDDSLSGLHMTLIPPRLNAVGDRMHDAGLAEAIRGDQKSPRLNWLRVRMPKFSHSPAEQAALLAQLVGHDRIPDGGPKTDLAIDVAGKTPDPQQILAGRELLGGKGFSCVACHAVKDYAPKVTALGTRGSNLHLIGQRMRTDYFFRWTRAPLRVMPGIEMPNYQRAHEFILPGRLDQQMIAIWQALNDPNLTAPTNPAVVEQLLSIGEKDSPRVVRDVFTVPGTEETVARAYAFGLPGGHSALFDLDTCSIRAWTLGDFARQRCEGKRWYWDLAGTVMATRFDPGPGIFLVHQETGEVIAPETGWVVECRLERDIRDERTISISYLMEFSKGDVVHRVRSVDEEFSPPEDANQKGWVRQISAYPVGPVWPWFRNSEPKARHQQAHVKVVGETGDGVLAKATRFGRHGKTGHPVLTIEYLSPLQWQNPASNVAPPQTSRPDVVGSVPGFHGQRLLLPRSIMPTALTWDHEQNLLFTSLKGHLYRVENSANPSIELIEEGLAAPFGVLEIPRNRQPGENSQFEVVVAHKPELLWLSLDSKGRVLDRSVRADGWGITDDYHDWTCGIARDSLGNLYIGLGSDYTFKNRPQSKSKWRGDILRIGDGRAESIACGLRYPTGLAIDDQDRLFCSDQQGVQNTFNELNYIQVGHRYGVPSRHDPEPNAPADPAAVQIPHPWTRSVNGIVWVPKSKVPGLATLSGHLLGCEMNNNMLVRMSVQTVGDTVQGAVYPFSKPAKEGDTSNFIGPLCIGISPQGEIYVGGLQDGGWAGGLNTGDIVKLTRSGELPNGIREIRATSRGFDVEFFHKVDAALAVQTSQYKISGYTRIWKGDYATPDSGHHTGDITAAAISNDGRTVSLTVGGRKTGHVYDISVGEIGTDPQRSLWPAIGHYTLHRIPD